MCSVSRVAGRVC